MHVSIFPLLRLFSFLLLLSAAAGWEYGWPTDWQQHWPDSWQQTPSEDCSVSHLTAYEMEKGREPVYFSTSPLDDFEAPKMLPLNSTGGEQWEFDGISEDGMLSFCFGFYRDPNYAILGTGNLRLSVEFAYADGKRFAQVDYPTNSIVESCPQGTRGVWKTKDYSYTFEISSDMSVARIGIDTPDVKGNVLMKSVTPPRYADGSVWPNANGTTATVPYFYWVEPIPIGTVAVDMVIEGKPYTFTGMGGHERLWSAFSWFTCLESMTAIRVLAEPYALTYVAFESNMVKGLHVPSVILVEKGSIIFSTRRTEPSDDEDYVVLTKAYGGAVTGSLKDKVTGFELVLVSPQTKRQWSFIITNKNVGFEYFLGEGVGGTGFSGSAIGGPIGLKQYTGMAFAESLIFPKNSYLFKPNYVA